jgi:hypothetical protein
VTIEEAKEELEDIQTSRIDQTEKPAINPSVVSVNNKGID